MGKFNCDKCDGPLDPSVWRICDNCKAEEKSADERLRHEWEEQQEAYRKRVRELEAKLDKIATWLERNAKLRSDEAKRYRGTWNGLADATEADSKNYAATAKDIRRLLEGK